MSRNFSEIMNVKIPAGSRILYLDLAQNKDGTKFLSISEVRESNKNQRSRILVDEEYVADLHRAISAVMLMLVQNKPTEVLNEEGSQKGRSRAYERWTTTEDNELKQAYLGGCGVNELAEKHGRATTAIISRLYQSGILKPTDKPRWN